MVRLTVLKKLLEDLKCLKEDLSLQIENSRQMVVNGEKDLNAEAEGVYRTLLDKEKDAFNLLKVISKVEASGLKTRYDELGTIRNNCYRMEVEVLEIYKIIEDLESLVNGVKKNGPSPFVQAWLNDSAQIADIPINQRVMTHLYYRKCLIESCLKEMYEKGEWKLDDLIVIAIHLYGERSEEMFVSLIERTFVTTWKLTHSAEFNNMIKKSEESGLYESIPGSPWKLKLTQKGKEHCLPHIEQLALDAK